MTMKKQIVESAESDITLVVKNDQVQTTSIQVAEVFEKQHKHVIDSIEKLECSDVFRKPNFRLTSKMVSMPNGAKRKDKCYNITKDGFVLLAMGFTGKRAMQFKEAYIKAFNQMEQRLLDKHNKSLERLSDQCRTQLTYIEKLEKEGIQDTTEMMPEHLRQMVHDINTMLDGNQNMLLMSISRNTGFTQAVRIRNFQSVIAGLQTIIKESKF